MFEQASDFIEPLKALHRQIRDAVVTATEQQSMESLASVSSDEQGDTIFEIDRVSEKVLVEVLERDIASHVPVILIAEGIEPDGTMVLPRGADAAEAVWRIIVDPIDGTRGIMFQKRSAWILTGVASNRGETTSLADIQFALQTEIPLVKQHLSDTFWALEGQGALGERTNRITGDSTPLNPSPSTSCDLRNGFVTVDRFFPGIHGVLGRVYDDWMQALLGDPEAGEAQCFEDQYISSGGQLAELLVGHDRLVADLRPLVERKLREQGKVMGLCSHPYDLCTELIAREAGVVVCDERGEALNAPLDIHADVTWIGLAAPELKEKVLPVLREVLRRHGLF